MPDSPNLWDAFGAAIDAGPVLTDAFGGRILDQVDGAGTWPRFYRGTTRPNAAGMLPPPGYVLLGQEFETEAGWYNGEAGQDGLYRLHCWARTPDDANRLYRWLKQRLHNVLIAVEGYQPVTGIFSKTGPIADAEGTAWQVEARYEAEPMEVTA